MRTPLLAAVLCLTGCSLGAEHHVRDDGDAGGGPEPLRFVVASLSVPRPTGTEAVGFDLDGRASVGDGSTCDDITSDYTSVVGDGEGVDNTFETLVPDLSAVGGMPIDDALARDIAAGETVWLLAVTGFVEFARTEYEVEVWFGRGRFVGSGTPVTTAGGLAPGQSFEAIDAGSRTVGRMSGGRLHVQLGADFELRYAAGDVDLPLAIHQPQIAADVTPGALAEGALGGWLDVDELAHQFEAELPAIEPPPSTWLDGVGDLAPRDGAPLSCERMSIGAAFGATSAHFDVPE